MNISFADLQPDTVLDAVEAFGVQVSGHCYPLNSYENRVFQVGVEGGSPVIAKFYRPGRWSREQIQEEHDFTAKLLSKGVSTAKNLNTQSGESIIEWKGFFASVQEKVLGRIPEVDNFDNLYQLGQVVGQMHAAIGNQSLKARSTYEPQIMGSDNVDYLSASWIPKKMQTGYRKAADQLLQKIANCLPANFNQSFITIHGDCHLSNVLMAEDTPVLLDFDDVMAGPAVQDLWMFLAGSSTLQSQQLSELLEGYQESLEFDLKQLSWIPALRSLRVINYTAWLAKRWNDPAFKLAFPWFNSEDFWVQHIKELEQLTKGFNEVSEQLSKRGGNY